MDGVITSSGQSVGDLKDVINEKESQITSIIATAFAEQRSLRDEDIQAIQTYNQEVQDALNENVQAYESGMQGVADAASVEGQITSDQAASDIATIDDYQSQAMSDLESYHNSRLQELNNEYENEGSLTEDQYADLLRQENDYYSTSQDQINQTADNATTAVLNAMNTSADLNQSTLDTISSTKDALDGVWRLGDVSSGVGAYLNTDVGTVTKNTQELSDALSSLASQANSDFLTAQLGIVDAGGTISAQNASNIDTILSAFDDLPPELGDAGTKAMQALASGMDAELGIDVANSTADEIVAAFRSKIGDAKVAGTDYSAGLKSGLEEGTTSAEVAAGTLASTVIEKSRSIFDEHSPSVVAHDQGYNYAIGLSNGIDEGNGAVDSSSASAAQGAIDTVDAGWSGSSWLGSLFSDLLSGGISGNSSVSDASGSMASAAYDQISGIWSGAFTWGEDMVSGIADGIWSMISTAASAASDLATTIASYLHFTEPEQGPLHGYHEWMGHFIGGLSDDLAAATPELASQAASAADTLAQEMALDDYSLTTSLNAETSSSTATVSPDSTTTSSLTDSLTKALSDKLDTLIAAVQASAGDTVLSVDGKVLATAVSSQVDQSLGSVQKRKARL
jgi:hypothetical protein